MQGTVTFLASMAHQGDYIRWKLPLIVVPSRASHTPTKHEGVRNATTVGVRNVMTGTVVFLESGKLLQVEGWCALFFQWCLYSNNTGASALRRNQGTGGSPPCPWGYQATPLLSHQSCSRGAEPGVGSTPPPPPTHPPPAEQPGHKCRSSLDVSSRRPCLGCLERRPRFLLA